MSFITFVIQNLKQDMMRIIEIPYPLYSYINYNALKFFSKLLQSPFNTPYTL